MGKCTIHMVLTFFFSQPHLSPNNNAVPIIGNNATSTIKSESYDTTTSMSKYGSTSLYSPQHGHHSPHSLHSPHPIPQPYPARQHVGQIDTQQRLQDVPSHRPHPIQPHNQIYQHHIQQDDVQYQLPNVSQFFVVNLIMLTASFCFRHPYLTCTSPDIIKMTTLPPPPHHLPLTPPIVLLTHLEVTPINRMSINKKKLPKLIFYKRLLL
jgi:hypothetical protein